MSFIAVTQRVVLETHTGERRDALDQRWAPFLLACGLHPVVLPNHLATARGLLHNLPIRGVLLTGGNDLVAYGGDAPERDEVENELLDAALRRDLPLLGVCRGMQLIQHRFGVPLVRVEGHVRTRFPIEFAGHSREINSYHCYGAIQSVPELEVLCQTSDGVIKAIRHSSAAVAGIMWHPEREQPFNSGDLEFFRTWFAQGLSL